MGAMGSPEENGVPVIAIVIINSMPTASQSLWAQKCSPTGSVAGVLLLLAPKLLVGLHQALLNTGHCGPV